MPTGVGLAPPRIWFAALALIAAGCTEATREGPTRMPAATRPTVENRLRHATSPYLQQHRLNPVDWYEWGREAIERAKREDKPIFLSIGYAACHWCHVMSHESFENPEIAEVMNRLFINVKIDREERPDIDDIYMRATQALNDGQGGWPMSVWLTPDLRPFFAGTYFPPTSRWGRPGFKEVCERIDDVWRSRRSDINEQADRLTAFIRETLTAAPSDGHPLDLAVVDATAEQLAGAFDKTSGGISGGGTNKFPPSMAMDVMLRSAVRRADGAARRLQLTETVELTLCSMAMGGIYDQFGGGIHRYSTDVEWHVPHFEKMLYDQALVSRIYLDAFRLTGKPFYARIAREIFDYVLGDLRDPAGGFYSTRDADSDGQEGKYYVWTRDEVFSILDPEDAKLLCAHYDISESGNWEDPYEPGARKSIPRLLRDKRVCAKLFGVCEDDFMCRVAAGRAKLLAARSKRIPPALDDKILVEWNGLMISSLARGGAVLGERRYIEAAAQAAEFILSKQHQNGRLMRSYRDGRALDVAFLSDYAALIEGLIELYEATFEKRWLDQAHTLAGVTMDRFWCPDVGGFFFTAGDHEPLITRGKDVRDNAIPSGNSLMLMNLLRLGTMLDDARCRERAAAMLRVFAAEVAGAPWSSERFLAAVDFAASEPLEIAIVGELDDPRTQALLRHVQRCYLPNRVLMHLDPERPDDAPRSPLLAGKTLVNGAPAAYICRNYACRSPATTPAELEEMSVSCTEISPPPKSRGG